MPRPQVTALQYSAALEAVGFHILAICIIGRSPISNRLPLVCKDPRFYIFMDPVSRIFADAILLSTNACIMLLWFSYCSILSFEKKTQTSKKQNKLKTGDGPFE